MKQKLTKYTARLLAMLPLLSGTIIDMIPAPSVESVTLEPLLLVRVR